MAHDHMGGIKHRGALIGALAINATFMFVEAAAGILTNSLVLIADAGHMLTDVVGVSGALIAIWIAQRPANMRKTYGYYRAEILAALGNAVLLFGVSAYIIYEAVRRFQDPPDVPGLPILAVAFVGLIANLLGVLLLARGAGENMNVRGAFLDMVADVLGSLGAIAAGIVLITTGWQYADPLFAVAVGIMILPRTWKLLKGAIDVLLEGTPTGMKTEQVAEAVMTVPGVMAVHDLHVWSVGEGFVSLSAHVETDQGRDQHDILLDLRRLLAQKFDIEHATLQLETLALHEELEACCGMDAGRASATHASKHS